MISRNPNGATPRTMNDCTFQSWADPLERPTNKPSLYWRFINWLTK